MIGKIHNSIEQIKQKFQDKYLNLSEIVNTYFEVLLKYNLVSTKIDDVPAENIRRNRLIVCWCIYIVAWLMAVLHIFILSKCQWMFAYSNLPPKLNVLFMMINSYLWFTIVIRHDFLMTDMRDNLLAFKSLYNECRENSRLNGSNYRKLSFLAGVLYKFFITVAPLTILIAFIFMMISIWLITGSILWLFMIFMQVYTTYLNLTSILSFVFLLIIVLAYYRMLFNQINEKINQMIKLKTRKSLTQLIKQIHEHHKISVEIDQLNKCIRKSVAFLFLILSIGQVLLLYLLIEVDVIYIKIFVVSVFITNFISSLLLCNLLSLQIKASHQSYNRVLPFIRKSHLSYRIKWKVRQELM